MEKLPLLKKIELSELSELTELNEEVLLSLGFKEANGAPDKTSLFVYYFNFDNENIEISHHNIFVTYGVKNNSKFLYLSCRKSEEIFDGINLTRNKFLLNDLVLAIKLILEY
jgi:hypothetical protein